MHHGNREDRGIGSRQRPAVERAPLSALKIVLTKFVVAGLALAVPIQVVWAASAYVAAPATSELVAEYVRANKPTAIIAVQADQTIANWGEIHRRVNLRSIRKSLLSALYGIAISEHKINLTQTLEQLGIDDVSPHLTAIEKKATVRDLLMARSGIFHAAAYETGDMRRKRPALGSHGPGSFWYYNNWDFNALGTIYRVATGEDIFQSFSQRIAKPIGMENFSANDGRYVREASSIHPAYVFNMSARDLSLFGLLFLDGGRWHKLQIIPSAWVNESTTSYSRTDRDDRGYGYLWWTLPPEDWGPNAFMASGYGGQFLIVAPSKRLIAAQTVDLQDNPRGVRAAEFLKLIEKVAAATP
ncbi:serine hydrolase [Bradyrhizobium sp. BR 10261]|uniref:serine hydrolase domain-containing protein n=1 Tax=Bradyrhizobium sp. BR 10261 TaxID=2749992 RepID=UPI001C64FA66|nr:serine hydrolase [Bradyrhizobium sp. BR 10261]MBW7967144.1 serine hydrolase [Bradyrhizobium sp. BR 10261]